MRSLVVVLFAVLLSPVFRSLASAESPGRFDFEHVEKALLYFASADVSLLDQIAESRATEHLLTHSQRTGYYPLETSALELTMLLVTDPGPEGGRWERVKALVDYVRSNSKKQVSCLSEAKKYLPDGFVFASPLFATWGYDIGVAMDGSASLNLAHDHFLEGQDEIWFFCLHEMHHAGVTSYHPMVEISKIATTQQLFGFLKYSTFLEGTATYSAYEAREGANALSGDRDYVALSDKARMDRYHARFFEVYERMKSARDRGLEDGDWQILEDFSDGDRLWYRVGAVIAASIDERLGRDRFKEIIAEGPDAFFEAYFSLEE